MWQLTFRPERLCKIHCRGPGVGMGQVTNEDEASRSESNCVAVKNQVTGVHGKLISCSSMVQGR